MSTSQAAAQLPAARSPRWRSLLWLTGGALALVVLLDVSIKALAPLWDWLLGSVVGVDLNARVGSSVRFFCYDTSKLVLLLAGIVFAVAVLRSFMSVERTRALLGGKREGVGNVLAATLGVATPFRSCPRCRRSSVSSQPVCRSA